MFERRLRAYSIDLSFAFALATLAIIILKGFEKIDIYLKWIIVFACYFGVMIIPHFLSKGQTLGKKVQKIKVVLKTKNLVEKEYFTPPLYLLILRESVKAIFSFLTFGFYLIIAGLIASNHEDGRTIHDYIFGTRVIALTKYTTDRNESVIVSPVAERLKGSTYHD